MVLPQDDAGVVEDVDAGVVEDVDAGVVEDVDAGVEGVEFVGGGAGLVGGGVISPEAIWIAPREVCKVLSLL